MRLMPTVQLQDKKAQDLARDLLRIEEINKASDKARKELANAEADFKSTLARQRVDWAQCEEEHAKRSREMDSEITVLEKRKEQALIPIEMYKREVDEKMSEALSCLEKAKSKELEVQELSDRLQDKLDVVGQQTQDLIARDKKVTIREQNNESREIMIKQNSEDLVSRMINFNNQKQQSEREFFELKESLVLKERSLLAKEEQLKRTEQSLNEWSVKLKDERGVLERAFERLSPQNK